MPIHQPKVANTPHLAARAWPATPAHDDAFARWQSAIGNQEAEAGDERP
jgi:hypothetical protein